MASLFLGRDLQVGKHRLGIGLVVFRGATRSVKQGTCIEAMAFWWMMAHVPRDSDRRLPAWWRAKKFDGLSLAPTPGKGDAGPAIMSSIRPSLPPLDRPWYNDAHKTNIGVFRRSTAL